MATSMQSNSSFETYVRNLLNFFQTAERRLLDVESAAELESGQVAEPVLIEQQAIFDREFDPYINWLSEREDSHLTAEQRIAEGRALRVAIAHFTDQAPFLARAIAKPRGYAGDSDMMRMAYANTWEGKSLFGKVLHKYFIGMPPAQAIRNRRSLIVSEVLNLSRTTPAVQRQNALEIMSVACGPAQEVIDIMATEMENLLFTLLDQDGEALQEARATVTIAQRLSKVKCEARFVQDSIGVFLKPKKLAHMQSQLRPFDFIYSMGLYDYLDAQTAKRLTTSLLTLLKPDGVLLVGNYLRRKAEFATHLDYWTDWPLIYRSEEELRSLVEPCLAKQIAVDIESAGCQLFLRITRSSEVASEVKEPELARL